MKHGIIIVNKPGGITSHDVVDYVRKKLKVRRVGHAGTLDPIATGVLLILVGRCTKLFNHFAHFDKAYSATLTLGKRTTSGDRQGEVIHVQDYSHIREHEVRDTLQSHIGNVFQVPPMISAVKHKGIRLYTLGRRGIVVNRQPRQVTVKELKLLEFAPPLIKFYLECSKGTYVRQLAEDIAKDLGCVGYISEIERKSIGPFDIVDAVPLSGIDESSLRPYPF
ncbi:MAG: tRNA pseudouridine(55) synthase TruB [Candidatus Omnitrophota bacterium]